MVKKGQVKIGYQGRRLGFDGSERLVGQANRYSTISYQAIVAYAAKAAAVPESSIEMSMEALFDALNYFVLNGHSVQIPYLGTFSLTVRAKSATSEAEFSNNFAQNLRNVKVNFLPDSELKSLIASTSITTETYDDEYEGNGVIAIKSAYFGSPSTLYPMNAGRPYEMEGLSRIVLNGTRLNKEYLAPTAVAITFVDANGAEHTERFGGAYLNQSYNTLVINLSRIAEAFPSYVYIKSIVVAQDEVTYLSKNFAAVVEDTPKISGVTIGNKPVLEGATISFEAGKAVSIKMLVSQSAFVDEVTIGGVAQQIKSAGEGYVVVDYTPQASGNAPIAVKAGAAVTDTYNISFGEAGALSIASITANGDPLYNGGVTNIVAGENYAINIAGTGLDALTAENFVLPAGTTIVFTSQSGTLIAATINNAQAGDLKIIVDDVILFTSGLVAVTPTVSVTGFKLSPTGATQNLGTQISANSETGAFSIYLVGQELDELTIDEFSGTGISNIAWDAESGQLSGVVDNGTRTLVVRNDGTTIANLYINKPSQGGGGGGDDYDPNA